MKSYQMVCISPIDIQTGSMVADVTVIGIALALGRIGKDITGKT